MVKEEVQNYLLLSGEIFNTRRILAQEEDDFSFQLVDFEISIACSDMIQ